MAQDEEGRIEGLIAGAALLFRQRFMAVVRQISDRFVLEQLEVLLRSGQFETALGAAEIAAGNLANAYSSSFARAAEDTARFISNSVDVVVSFDQTNERAVEAMRRNQLRLVREFTTEQRFATRLAMVDAITRGLNPREQAAAFRASIGLTRRQVQAVINYRRLLESGSSAALQRALRDRRFDSTVSAAVAGDRPLTAAQIDTMVGRYEERYVRYRSEVIARTEALRSVHEGVTEAFQQAIDQGALAADEIVREWVTARDERVRTSHSAMNGQRRPIGQPFLSGAGNQIRYPGDIDAPGSETIQCRCVLTTQFAEDAPISEVVA